MKIVEDVYITEVLAKHKKRLLKRVQQNKSIPKLYCIVRPIGNVGLFEIYDYGELRKDYYEDKDIVVVGLALSKDDANIVLKRMISDMYRDGKLEVKQEFFMKEN